MGKLNYIGIGGFIGLGTILSLSGCTYFSNESQHAKGSIQAIGMVSEILDQNQAQGEYQDEAPIGKVEEVINKAEELEYYSEIDEDLKSEYIDALQENERYIISYESTHPKQMMISESGNHVIKLNTIDELVMRLEQADLDFYIPKYIPEGFNLKEIGLYYYLNYDNFNPSMIPIEEKELGKDVIFKVYKMEENYYNSVEEIYLTYTDGTNTITYTFGLDFAVVSNNSQPVTQFAKEEYTKLLSTPTSRFQVNQKIEAKEVFTGIPPEGSYNSPDYFNSIQMRLDGEGITDEEVLKIANSIYKCN